MIMNKEQIALAVRAGLELIGPESDVRIPARLNDGIFLLKQLLAGIAKGQVGLSDMGEGRATEAPPDEGPP